MQLSEGKERGIGKSVRYNLEAYLARLVYIQLWRHGKLKNITHVRLSSHNLNIERTYMYNKYVIYMWETY